MCKLNKIVSILTVILFLCSNIACADVGSYQFLNNKKYSHQKLRVPVGQSVTQERIYRSIETSVFEKSLGRIGFYVLTQTIGKAKDPTYDENIREFNIRGTMRHVINEQERVFGSVEVLQQAAAAYRENRMAEYREAIGRFGVIVKNTYKDLKDDYRNATPAIIALCGFLNAMPEVIGSRHVGAGWGGNVIAWVEDRDIKAVLERTKDFIRSDIYKDALRSIGVKESELDEKIKEVLSGIQEYVPGPGAGVLMSGNIDRLLEELEKDDSKEMKTLKEIYGEKELESEGQMLPYYRIEQKRNVTLLQEFKKQHPDASEVSIARSGGRVVVSGEHSDFNHGLVLNAPTLFDTLVVVAKRKDNNVVISAMDNAFPETIYDPAGLDIRNVSKEELSGQEWYRYPAYTINFLNEQLKRSTDSHGLDIMVDGRPEYKAVPVAAGISSSAALDVAISMAYLNIIGASLTASQITIACQKSENAIGFPCGAQDPYGALRGLLPGAEKGRAYAQVMDNTPTLDKDGNPVIDARLVELPVNLRGVLINTGTKSDRTQLEFSVRFDEGMIGAIMILHALKNNPKYKGFFAKFNSSDLIARFYINKELGTSIKGENTDTFPLFYKPFYFSLRELQRVGLDITEKELQEIIAGLPDNISKDELENVLGKIVYEDMIEIGGINRENLDKVIDRLVKGTEKSFQAGSYENERFGQMKEQITDLLDGVKAGNLLNILSKGLFIPEESI